MSELSDVLEELKKLGKITDEDIRRVSWASEKKRQVVDSLHLLFCKDNHDTTCEYFKEDLYDECWKLEAHQVWMNKADEICKGLGVAEDPAQALQMLSSATDLVSRNSSQIIYLALSVLLPELFEALPLETLLAASVTVPVSGDVPALPPDREVEGEQNDQGADTTESE